MIKCNYMSTQVNKYCRCCYRNKSLASQTDSLDLNTINEIVIKTDINDESHKITEIFLDTNVPQSEFSNNNFDIPKLELSNICKKSLSDFLNESYLHSNINENESDNEELIVNTEI